MELNEAIIDLKGVSYSYDVDFLYPQAGVVKKKIKALDNIDLELYKGDSLAVLGPNGAGKTTLLKLIAGILKPEKGELKVQGKVCGVFELGTGFVPELTGYDNLKTVLSLYNVKDENVLRQIIEFSELEDFIYAPIKTYSQGMYLRLAFSIAIFSNPDILILDDILAVGDFHFQKKCIEKIKELISNGKTVIVVTHNLDLADYLCEKCIILEKGKLIASGTIRELKSLYQEIVGNIWGIANLERGETKVIFNNGRISLRYRNKPITTDLGLFAILKYFDYKIDTTDLKWKAAEKSNCIQAYGIQRNIDEIVCRIEIKLDTPDHLKISFDTTYNEVEPCIMLDETYVKVSGEDKTLIFPPIGEQISKDWHKIADLKVEVLKLFPDEKKSLPTLEFTFGSILSCLLFNRHFDSKCRIVQIKNEKPRIELDLKLRQLSEPIEHKIRVPFFVEHNTIGFNWDLIEGNIHVWIRPLLKGIGLASYPPGMLRYKLKEAKFESPYMFKLWLECPDDPTSLLMVSFSWISNKEIRIEFFSPLFKEESFVNEVNLIFTPELEFYTTPYEFNRVPFNLHEIGNFNPHWVILKNRVDHKEPHLKITFNREAFLQIGRNLYTSEEIFLRFYTTFKEPFVINLERL
jgi:ABC-type polysaccharide/polyol phosphate transport system ATPase subunit